MIISKFPFNYIIIFILSFSFACNTGKKETNDKDVLLPQDSIFIKNQTKTISEKTPIPFYTQKDVIKGSFKISDTYWADIEYHINEAKLKAYINGKLSNSHLNNYLEPGMGVSISTYDANKDGYIDIEINEYKAYLIHCFIPNEERFVPKSEMPEVETEEVEEIRYESLKNMIGIVSYRAKNDDEFITLLNENNTQWLKFNFSREEYNRVTEIEEFQPKEFSFFNEPELHFYCTREKEDFYEVIVNQSTQETKRLTKSPNLTFATIEEHLKYCFVFIKSQDNRYRDKPNGKYIDIEPDDESAYVVTKVDGNWAFIRDHYNEKDLGWVQWKENNLLLLGQHYVY